MTSSPAEPEPTSPETATASDTPGSGLTPAMGTMLVGLFQQNLVLIFLGLVMVLLVVQILTSSTFLMLLPRPRAIIIALLLIFSLLTRGAIKASEWFARRYGVDIPTVRLWLIPLTSLFAVYLLMMILLVGVHTWIDRAFWSTLSQLNAKMTTVMFTTTFASFKIYIFVGFLGAIWHYLRFFLTIFEVGGSIKEAAAIEDSVKRRAARFNRVFFFGLGILCFLLGTVIVFFKPETILYYRGELQIRSGVHPEVALETFRHLQRKYPGYKFLDTVAYRAAWVIDRRLHDYPAAIAAYEAFLQQYGYRNVWANDIVANLIVIHLDKLRQPREALRWIAVYEEQFPHGDMLPHIALYKARALLQENRATEADQVIAAARETFRSRHLILYDNEDDFITTLPFEIAIGTLNR